MAVGKRAISSSSGSKICGISTEVPLSTLNIPAHLLQISVDAVGEIYAERVTLLGDLFGRELPFFAGAGVVAVLSMVVEVEA